MKKAVLFAIPLVLVVTWLVMAQQRQAPRSLAVAHVSAQRIGTDTTEGRAGVARVQAVQRERAEDVRRKQQALEATRSQMSQAQAGDRARLQAQEQQQRVELERSVAKAQVDIQAVQREVNADLLAKVKAVVAEIAPGLNIQLVLNSESAVVWAAPNLDLTDTVITRMNASPGAR